MKKLFILAASTLVLCNLNSCKTKSGDASCGTPIGKYLADGKIAEYDLPANPNGDTSVKQIYTAVTANIIQQKNTYLNILGTTHSTVPYYLKGCGRDVFINNDAYNMDAQVNAGNYFVKGDRTAGSAWNYTLNGQKYWCGCASKNNSINVPYGTLWADKIWFRANPAAVTCDTAYWNDTIGIVAWYGPNGYFQLMNKNF